MWWASHQGAGIVHWGKAQPWSRAVMALRICGGKTREARPMSRIRPCPPSTIGMMSASQAILRTVEAVTGSGEHQCPGVGARGSGLRVGAAEPFQQVTVVNGDHHLRAQPSRGGQVSGGESDFAATDEAVEEPLRPRALIQPLRCSRVVRIASRRHQVGPGSTRSLCSGVGTGCDAGPRVGGGIHDREQVFELVGRGEDFQMLQSAVCPPYEGALALAQFLLAGFLAVLVQGVRPPFGDPGQEVLVVLDRRPGEGMLHPGGILGCGHVPDPVQGKADNGRRP